MQAFIRASGGLALALVLAACSDPAGVTARATGAAMRDAQSPSASQVTSADGLMMTVAPEGAVHATQEWVQPFGPNSVRVHSSLGDGGSMYDCCIAFTVSGINTVVGQHVESAMAFTPKANYTLTGIAMALSQVSGPNIYKVSLNIDNGGIPGAPIRSWTVSNLPIFGGCCGLVVVSIWSALPVTQGTRYWVVAAPESKSSWGGWNLNNVGVLGYVSQKIGGAWLPGGIGTQGAFAVYGR